MLDDWCSLHNIVCKDDLECDCAPCACGHCLHMHEKNRWGRHCYKCTPDWERTLRGMDMIERHRPVEGPPTTKKIRKCAISFGVRSIPSGETIEVSAGQVTRSIIINRLIVPDDIAKHIEIKTAVLPEMLRPGDEAKLMVKNIKPVPWYLRPLVWCKLVKRPVIRFHAVLFGESVND